MNNEDNKILKRLGISTIFGLIAGGTAHTLGAESPFSWGVFGFTLGTFVGGQLEIKNEKKNKSPSPFRNII